MTATSVVAEAGTLGLPAVGASPDLEVASITEQSNTATTLKISAQTPAPASDSAGATLAVGEASNDLYTTVHTEETPENLVSIGGVEDTVLIIPEETVSQNDVEDFSNLVIAQVNDYVNVRSIPSEEGEILGKLYDDSVGEFVSEQDGWYEIKSGSVQGFVKGEYVVTGDEAVALAKEVGKRIATVTTTTLFVREEATTESPVIGMVPIEDELSVTEEGVTEGWIKVSVEEGEGYVSTEFVTLSTEFVKAESKAEEERRLAAEEAERKKANAAASNSAASKSGATVSGGSGAGGSVAGYALQFVGNPYVYGGSSLTNGTDCSGFVMSVYAHFGVGLPHSSGAQRGCGYDVGGLANAQPGDIVCYSGHVGIYIGNGQIVHASTAATGIKVSNANYRQVLSVRRIF
ncbi:MAG: SH3 domain-containing protein [Lachnospiraceae bacterium]|nr:SH3 domain-containing protein [Lachnospiraceae bacterium]